MQINYMQMAQNFEDTVSREKNPSRQITNEAMNQAVQDFVKDLESKSQSLEPSAIRARIEKIKDTTTLGSAYGPDFTSVFAIKLLARGNQNLLNNIPEDIQEKGKQRLLMESVDKLKNEMKKPGLSRAELWSLFEMPEARQLRDNRDVALAFVTKDGNFLGRLHNFNNDEAIVLAAIKNQPSAFQFAGELRNDPDFIRKVVAIHPETFQYAGEAIRNNGELIYDLFKTNKCNVVPFAQEEGLTQLADNHPEIFQFSRNFDLALNKPDLLMRIEHGHHLKQKEKVPMRDIISSFIRASQASQGLLSNTLTLDEKTMYALLSIHPDMLPDLLEMLPENLLDTEKSRITYWASVMAVARDPKLQQLVPDRIAYQPSFDKDVEQEKSKLPRK